MNQGKYCIGLFLDIQGAFDTISPTHIKETLLEQGGHPGMINWYYNYLVHRNLIADIGGYKGEVSIDIGFPQGGVCSAKFWIIAFNKAVEICCELSRLRLYTPLAASYSYALTRT